MFLDRPCNHRNDPMKVQGTLKDILYFFNYYTILSFERFLFIFTVENIFLDEVEMFGFDFVQ